MHGILEGVWTDRWIKNVNKKRRAHQPKAKAKTHGCVYRILNGISSKSKSKSKAKPKDV